jgi:outer membrane protein assembly factor BamB
MAALMIVSIGASMALIPTTSAATTKSTFAYIEALPHNVGVGDDIMIYMWVNQIAPSALMTNDYRLHNFQLTITKPDNTTETKTWETVWDTTSNQGYVYVPDMVGTYTVKFTFPQQNVNATSHAAGATADDVFLGSTTTTTFTVQENSIGRLPDSYPLPVEYWTRPIYGENSFWYTISSNWLGNGAPGYLGFESTYNYGGNGALFPSDAIGSETSHIMWTKSLQSGGVVGGNNFEAYPGNTYFEGSAYLERYTNPIIVNGKLIYTESVSYYGSTSGSTVCVDLRTGEELWRNPNLNMAGTAFALIWDAENPNQHGVYNPLLVSTAEASFDWATFTSIANWTFYDADTGVYLYKAYNIPSGRSAMGPNGEYLMYCTARTPQGYTVSQWNSTRLWDYSSSTPTFAAATNANTAARYDYVKPITYHGANWTTPFTVVEAYYGDSMLCYNGTLASTGTSFFFGATASQDPYNYFLVNLNDTKGTVGAVSWYETVTPTLNATIIQAGVDPVNRVFVENLRELNAFNGYDLDTGDKLWSTKDYPQTAMDYYGSPASASLSNMFAYGKMYSSGYAGIVYCYDTTDGSLLWTYGNGGASNSTDGGFAVPGNYPTFINAYGNGIIYTVTTEHTIETPLYKGALSRALNATTGEEIWTLNSYVGEFMYQSYAIADGYNTWFNGLTNEIYVVGRGASQLTVSAPNLGAASGQSVMISGSVTDIASGTTQNEQAARFPNGVPVSSDASMKDWMGYVYQQKPLPTNFTGVEVVINVVDANGNYRTIGTAQTDATGQYSLAWMPDISGKFTVIATFAGSKGYWPAMAETAFVVDQPVATATPQPTQPPSAADLYFLPISAALLVAIVVVGLLTIVVLKKRP